MATVIDTHFHWYPESHYNRMLTRLGFSRTQGEDGRVIYSDANGHTRMAPSSAWFDLDAGLAVARQASGDDTTVICTGGVLSGLLDQASTSDAIDIAVEYNEQMAATQRRFPGRVYAAAYVSLQDTNEAIRLVDHAVKELDLHGINLPAVAAGELVDVSRLEDFYSRVEELGVPLIIHPQDVVYGQIMNEYNGAMQLTVGRLLDASMTVLRLIFSGVLERHPNLKVVQTHAGGILPYQAGRIDKNARIATLPQPPSEYLKRVFVDTVAPQALTVRTAVAFFGFGNVLYGSDYPCWSQEKALEVLDEAELGYEDPAAALSRNAAAVFNLPYGS